MRSLCFRKAWLAFLIAGVCLFASVPVSRAQDGNLAKGFPRLDHQFNVIDRSGKDYNCVAYTLGIQNQWIDPKTGPANAPFSFMDQLYGAYGYHRTSALDLRNNPNQQKIAVYATQQPNGTIKEITHAALQEPDGSWASKLGHLPLIRHADPYAVDGPTYGAPVATYVRDASNRGAAAVGNKGQAQNGKGAFPQNAGAAKNTSPLAGAVRQTGATVSGKSTNNGGLTSVAGDYSYGLQFGLGPFVSAAARHGLHGTELAAYIHELQAMRVHGHAHFAAAFRNAGTSCGGFANDTLAGNGAAAGNVKGSMLSAGNAANTAGGPQNLGSAKNAGNSLNSLAGNQGSAKNSRNTNGGPQNVGNSKNAGNSLNALVNNSGCAKNAGNAGGSQNGKNTANTRSGGNGIGSLPGTILVKINGNGNTVNINLNFGAAKPASNGAPNGVNAKNGNATQQNSPVAKNAGKTSGTTNVGNVKNGGTTLNALTNNTGRAKNAGNTGTPQIAKNTARTQKSPGALVGNNALTKNAAIAKDAVHQTKKTSNSPKGPGALVGNNSLAKNAGNSKTVTPTIGSAKNAGHVSKTPGVNHALAKVGGDIKSGSANVGAAKNVGQISNSSAGNQVIAKNLGNAKSGLQNGGTVKNAGHVINALTSNHGAVKNVNTFQTPKIAGSVGGLKIGNAQQQFVSKTSIQTRPANVQTVNRSQQLAANHQSAFQRGVVQANSTGRKK